MSDTILAEDHGTWVEITLNRPDRLNSFNDEMHTALRARIEAARDAGARAILLTAKLAEGPTVELGLTKQAIHAAGTNSFAEQLELEAESQKVCGESPDYAEGVSAFLNKRQPRFSGRRRS